MDTHLRIPIPPLSKPIRVCHLNSLWIKILAFTVLCSCFSIANGQSYLGEVNKQVNFREGPGTDYPVISSLPVGRTLFIISTSTENDFYNIIDIATNKEGYVHKSFVTLQQVVPINTEGIFTPSGKTNTSDAELEIYNNTSLNLTLKMNQEVYYFNPGERKNIVVFPGTYSYRASAPGVIPDIGKERLDGNTIYSWEFYVSTVRR